MGFVVYRWICSGRCLNVGVRRYPVITLREDELVCQGWCTLTVAQLSCVDMCASTVHTRIRSCQMCANHFTWACVLVMAIESVLTGWPNTHIRKQQTTWCVRDDGWCLVASVTVKFIWITLFLCFSLSLYQCDMKEIEPHGGWADAARVINLLGKRREMTRQIEREVRFDQERSARNEKDVAHVIPNLNDLFPSSTKSVYYFPCTCSE